MIDLHCHILPNLDDGPQSQAESMAMAKRAVEDGVRTIVATPHTLNGVYTNHIQKVISDVATLQDAFSNNHIDLRLYAGADVHLCPDMLGKIESGDAGTIDNAKRYLLLEFPPQTIPPGIKDEVFNLKVHGVTPIITHPERHPLIHHDMDILYELVRMGALCQLTAMSISGDFGGVVMGCAEMLLRHRLIHLIASDAHSPDSRPPLLSRAVETAAEIMGNYEDAERMVTDVPAAILSGDIVEVPEPFLAKGV
jgi:protein-tyrosine phosphatase